VNVIELCAVFGSDCNTRNGEYEIWAITRFWNNSGKFGGGEIFVNIENFYNLIRVKIIFYAIYESALLLERSQAPPLYSGKNNMQTVNIERRWNDTGENSTYLETKTCLSSILSTKNPTWTCQVLNWGLRAKRASNNLLSHWSRKLIRIIFKN